MDVDKLPGTQDPANAYWHAMRDPWQSVAQARELFEDYVESSLAQCDDKLLGLARALHAVQDNASAAHSGMQVWDGGWTRWHAPGPVHLFRDAFRTPYEHQDAVEQSKRIVERYQKKCGCRL